MRVVPFQCQIATAFVCLLIVRITGPFVRGDENPIPPKLHSVLVSAETQLVPPQLTLSWPGDTNATNYTIYRKPLGDSTWAPLDSLAGDATRYVDNSLLAARRYEYQIIKATSAGYTGYGYLCAGIEAPLIDEQGKVILIVANTYATELAGELDQLQQDMTGDGWTVLRHDVAPEETPPGVKALIKADYDADPGHVKAVFLFGAVPVPYSGAIAPDGHTNHFGAWPADMFYAELHGLWTDSSVTATNAEEARNWNLPGDGKFDQSVPPGEVDVELGRVDLSNMTCFSNKTPSRSELDLLRQYLAKDHRFRHGLISVQRRALICDNFSDKGDDPIGGSGWRNFCGFFGASNIVEVGWSNYFPNVTSNSFLWSFGSGGGQYYTCTGVGSSDDFALQDPQVVFTMWLGSHFGDWDNESNFLRAPLGSTSYTLTSSYSGFPQWLYHPMALGETAGYCARLTQNNRPGGLYPPFNQGTNQVHIALLGDPTLRMHPVLPPAALSASNINGTVQLTWQASPELNLRGYHIYRASSPSGPFQRLSGNSPISSLSFSDTPPAGDITYLVRAVKLEVSSSGSYLNPSQGIFMTLSGGSAGALTLDLHPAANGQLQLHVDGESGAQFVLEQSSDLANWTAWMTNLLSTNSYDLTVPASATVTNQFFRGRLNSALRLRSLIPRILSK